MITTHSLVETTAITLTIKHRYTERDMVFAHLRRVSLDKPWIVDKSIWQIDTERYKNFREEMFTQEVREFLRDQMERAAFNGFSISVDFYEGPSIDTVDTEN